MPGSFMEELGQIGFTVDSRPGISDMEARQSIGEFTGLVFSTATMVDRNLIDAGTGLTFVARAGSGMDNVDVEHVRSRGIECISSAEGNRDSVAEHAVGMLLSLLHRISNSNYEVNKGIWEREGNRGEELLGKTVSILGLGNTGSEFARRMGSFGVTLLANDTDASVFRTGLARQADMPEIFLETDVLSLHLPLTRETEGLVNEGFLRSFRKSIYVINTARGGMVHSDALVEALESGKVRGACLDVLEVERISPESQLELPWFRSLSRMPNVMMTPHIAGWSHQSKARIAGILIAKIKAHAGRK